MSPCDIYARIKIIIYILLPHPHDIYTSIINITCHPPHPSPRCVTPDRLGWQAPQRAPPPPRRALSEGDLNRPPIMRGAPQKQGALDFGRSRSYSSYLLNNLVLSFSRQLSILDLLLLLLKAANC